MMSLAIPNANAGDDEKRTENVETNAKRAENDEWTKMMNERFAGAKR